MEGLCSLTLLLLLLWPPETWEGLAPKPPLATKISRDPDVLHLGSGTGQEPVIIMTFNLTMVTRAISSFDLRTWDPEGVIFYGDTNPKDDWFMLGLRGGRPEVQIHNFWAQLTVGAGPRLDDGCWHQLKVKNQEDSVLLEVDGDEVLRLSQVSRPLEGTTLPTMRIAVGGLLFPPNDLRLPLIPALDGCLRRHIWLNQPGNTGPFSHPPRGACNPEAQPGTFLPPGAHTVFSLKDLPQPGVDPWAFSLELRLQFFGGSGCLLALGILGNQSLLSLDLQDQILVLSARSPQKLEVLSKSLPVSPGPLIQLELGLTRVALSQGLQEVVLILPPALLVSLLDLWTQPKGSLILGVAPGEASSASFCLDGLRVQGRELDVDQALSRSKNIWTHSCPRSLNNNTNTPH
ncbi:sex hormone-binding globulin isoform X2 [Trichosurus vulpecula]|uniref:sex hormone-binding globulin isoform X2 n=1 Tax=Trichosurus vulpecula TaxID=9337 RepID=UPI00186B448D|nr:sex hormone-binding globulin isoform X2 [Trichosurus vulpecula]